MISQTDLLNRITQVPGQCGGRPCIRGMRIRVTDVLEMLAENVSADEILDDFPDLELEDIQACLLSAVQQLERNNTECLLCSHNAVSTNM
ncbi:MAG: DUF433 domain-containing protein [Cyanobacteria bacterium J06638_22]